MKQRLIKYIWTSLWLHFSSVLECWFGSNATTSSHTRVGSLWFRSQEQRADCVGLVGVSGTSVLVVMNTNSLRSVGSLTSSWPEWRDGANPGKTTPSHYMYVLPQSPWWRNWRNFSFVVSKLELTTSFSLCPVVSQGGSWLAERCVNQTAAITQTSASEVVERAAVLIVWRRPCVVCRHKEDATFGWEWVKILSQRSVFVLSLESNVAVDLLRNDTVHGESHTRTQRKLSQTCFMPWRYSVACT